MTEAICDAAVGNAHILVIELEESYVQVLKEKYSRNAEIVHASAHLLPDLIQDRSWPRVDLIVSGLPFVLPNSVKKRLFDYLQLCTETGTIMRWFSYMPALMKPHYQQFDFRRHKFVLWNLPPMWVYTVN